MTTTDGSRVESAMPTHDDAASSLPTGAFRVRRADGATQHFASMSETLQHLRDHFDPDELSAASNGVAQEPWSPHREPSNGTKAPQSAPSS